ncbi:hypothetical protein V6N13_023063 [Hibiscus sabdariffa]
MSRLDRRELDYSIAIAHLSEMVEKLKDFPGYCFSHCSLVGYKEQDDYAPQAPTRSIKGETNMLLGSRTRYKGRDNAPLGLPCGV